MTPITGIYKIQSKVKPERIYIGSAINIMYRWRCHISNLKSHKHHSKKLQNHFNKYGKLDLQFSVLIGCNKEDLIVNEQFFIDSYNPYFNICKKAESRLGAKGQIPWNKGIKTGVKISTAFKKGHLPWNTGKKGLYKLSEKTKVKMRENNAMRGKPAPNKGKTLSIETREKMRKGQIERRLREINITLN